MAEDEVKREGSVMDRHGEKLTFRRLAMECGSRETAATELEKAGQQAAIDFVAFLRVPQVAEREKTVAHYLPAFAEVLNARNDREAADALITMQSKDRKDLAERLKAVLGGKRAKTVHLAEFTPRTNVI